VVCQQERIHLMKKLLLPLLALFTCSLSAFGQTPNYGSGFTSSGLTLNGGAGISGTRLRLTDGGAAEARSAFFSTAVNVQSFVTDFNFQLTNANADGFTFTIQGIGLGALGAGGGGLGYGSNSAGTIPGIGSSVAVGFQLYSSVLGNKEVSLTGDWTNGASPAATPGTSTTGSGVNLHSGDVMKVHMAYDGTILTWTITDSNTGKSFPRSVTINIPSFTGNTAFVGFTGGSGGLTAIQDVLTWTYTPGSGGTQQVATPTFSPAAGTYTSTQMVTISDTTTGTTIYYTTDGSTPTTSSAQFTVPITVSATKTVKAMAAASGLTNSVVATATYTISASGATTVTVSPRRAALTVGETLSIAATTNGAGVTWTATGGGFSSNSSASGVAVTFTAPATAGSHTITATSTTDATVSASLTVGVTDLAGVFTYHNNLSRDGSNAQEYALTTSLVNTATFGKLFSCNADGAIYAQPLWIANLNIAGGLHNVIIAATMRDSVYAFDADTSPCVSYWHKMLIPLGRATGATPMSTRRTSTQILAS